MRWPYFVVRDHIPTGGLRGANDIYSMLYVALGLGEGIFLIIGGPRHWQGEQFAVARQIPYPPYSWAAAILFFTVILGAGVVMADDHLDDAKASIRGWLICIGAMGCAGWCAFYAWCLWRAGIIYPSQVSLNGPFTWTFFATWYMIKAGQHLEFRLSGTTQEA